MSRNIIFALALMTVHMDVSAAQEEPRAASEELLVERRQLKPPTEILLVSFPEDMSLQEAFQEIGQRAGLTVLFDDAFRDLRTTVNLGSVSVEEALEKLTITHRLFYKILDPTTVVIIPDNSQKHRQYDEMHLHTFYVENAYVNEIANMFRTIAGMQRVQPSLSQKSITVRATADQLLVAQSILQRNDEPPAELTFEIEVLAADVESGRAQGLGLTSDGFLRFKAENGAKVLLSQTIRLTDGEQARLSIEEGTPRTVTEPAADVPSRKSIPSQSANSFPFFTTPDEQAPTAEESQPPAPPPSRAVGIQLILRPQVSLEGDIRLSVTLQATVPDRNGGSVSSSVRSRDVTTTVSMKDGETMILPTMFRVDDFGAGLLSGTSQSVPGDVFVAIGASVLRASTRRDVLPPLSMGTEQRIRLRLPARH